MELGWILSYQNVNFESVDDIIDLRSFIVGQAYGVNFDTYRFLTLK